MNKVPVILGSKSILSQAPRKQRLFLPLLRQICDIKSSVCVRNLPPGGGGVEGVKDTGKTGAD